MPTMKQFFVLVATLSVNAEAALLAHLKRTNNKSNTKMAVQGTVRISPSLDAGTTDALNLVEIAGRDQAFLDAPLGKNSRKAGNQRFDREAMGELFKNWEKAGGVDHAGMMNFLGSQNPADYQSNLTQILDQMDAATNRSHDAAQNYIDGVAADFHHCDPTQNGTLDQYKKAYEDGITPHNTCRDLELDYKTKLGNCTDMKKNFDEVNGNPSPATTCAVDGPGGESMEKWLDRMAQKFDTLNTTWHAKSEAYTAAQALVPGPGACSDATYTTKKSECDLLYVDIEDDACLYAFGTQSACIGYDDCYEDKASAFRNATNITIIGESERKVHWAGVQRIRCVLDALAMADDSKLTACLSAVGSDTSHLNITYPAQPAEVTCAAPTEYPCTADFNNTVFNGFPAGLAKPTCNTCTLPTTPATTSITWKEGGAQQKCKDTCSSHGLVCDQQSELAMRGINTEAKMAAVCPYSHIQKGTWDSMYYPSIRFDDMGCGNGADKCCFWHPSSTITCTTNTPQHLMPSFCACHEASTLPGTSHATLGTWTLLTDDDILKQPDTTTDANINAIATDDDSGDLYLLVSNRQAVYRLAGAAAPVLFAGTPSKQGGSFSGEGGPATSATLANTGWGEIAWDQKRKHLYISSLYEGRIMKVDSATGIITTFKHFGAGQNVGGVFIVDDTLYFPKGPDRSSLQVMGYRLTDGAEVLAMSVADEVSYVYSLVFDPDAGDAYIGTHENLEKVSPGSVAVEYSALSGTCSVSRDPTTGALYTAHWDRGMATNADGSWNTLSSPTATTNHMSVHVSRARTLYLGTYKSEVWTYGL